ncbi:hypothetical protein V8G54_031252 [Vigna mungo]|uniref:Uncharacterized protein n=1 Tax=Vigna mungo TaxID=3915 RepID=A0AAQ3RM05_VIGMU
MNLTVPVFLCYGWFLGQKIGHATIVGTIVSVCILFKNGSAVRNCKISNSLFRKWRIMGDGCEGNKKRVIKKGVACKIIFRINEKRKYRVRRRREVWKKVGVICGREHLQIGANFSG